MTASFSVAQKIETYMILPANALMTAQGTYTGQNIGAGRTDRVMTGAKHTVIISEIISVCVLTVVFIFAEPIVSAFGLGAEAAGYCTSHVRCVALCLIPFASYFPLLGLFQGANDATVTEREVVQFSEIVGERFLWNMPFDFTGRKMYYNSCK